MGRKFRKAKITSTTVTDLAPGDTVMDLEEPGFGVRRQGDARVFFLRKYARGRRHFVTIGESGTGGLTVTEARKKAKKEVVAIRDGLVPSEQRARERAMPTVAELTAEWLEVHVDTKLKAATSRLYRSTLRTIVLPALGPMNLDQVGPDHVAGMHHSARRAPYAANRAIAILSKLFNFAERKGLRPRNSNPAKGLERYREERRERFLSREELARLGAALSEPQIVARYSPFALTAIALLLLTGMRVNEVLQLRWTEIDTERGLLLLPDSKSGAKAVVLGAHALRLLSSMPRTAAEWVFPGARPGQPLRGLRKPWAAVVRAAELQGVRLHDLRHTFASYSAGAGASLPIIGNLLGHSQPATTARYAHLAHGPVRDVADRVSEEIAVALGTTALAPALSMVRHV